MILLGKANDTWYCHTCKVDRCVYYNIESQVTGVTQNTQRHCLVCDGTKLGVQITVVIDNPIAENRV